MMQEDDDTGIDSGKCLKEGSSDVELQKKPQAVPAQTASVVAAQANSFADYFTLPAQTAIVVAAQANSFADFFTLFQDVVWFGLAFAAFVLWRCFTEMETGAAKLAQKTKISKDGADCRLRNWYDWVKSF